MTFKDELYYERITNMPKFADRMQSFSMRFTGSEEKRRSHNSRNLHTVDVRITVTDSGKYNEFKAEIEDRLFPFKTAHINVVRSGKEMTYYANDINARYKGYIVFEVLEKVLA